MEKSAQPRGGSVQPRAPSLAQSKNMSIKNYVFKYRKNNIRSGQSSYTLKLTR